MVNILIFGFGLSGKAVFDFLRSRSENQIYIYDDVKKDISIDAENFDFSLIKICYVSPGVPKNHQLLQKLMNLGVMIRSDLDLFFENMPKNAKLIGVTGTNGKSTTTAIITEILNRASFKAISCGNFGVPMLSVVHEKVDFFVIEMSSYQLESNKNYELDYGIILNITPDHIEHHGSYANYILEKEKILQHSKNKIAVAITDGMQKIDFEKYDDISLVVLKDQSENFKHKFLKSNNNKEIYFWHEKKLMMKNFNSTSNDDLQVFDADLLKFLSFKTHYENIAAAVVLSLNLGIDKAIYQDVISNFKGLEHRQEEIFNDSEIRFVNDSKATNLDATLRALENFEENVILLLGGISKGDDFSVLNSLDKKIRHIYIFGRDKVEIANYISKIPVTLCADLREIFDHHFAKPNFLKAGDVILFAPACASFDQFSGFEERGRFFKALVKNFVQNLLDSRKDHK